MSMIDPVALPGGAVLRPLEADDAPALLAAYVHNRAYLRPFEPARPESFWTPDGHRSRLVTLVERSQRGEMLACAMVRDGRILGCATLNTIVGGPFRSASLGYWVGVDETGRGLASAAAAALCRIADERLDLHRIDASTAPSNGASQRVLANNGFEQYGLARNYLHLDGGWQDSCLFQKILNDRPPAPA